MRFRNRAEAGRALARYIAAQGTPSFDRVIALPRGGVPVAYEIALALGVPLDIFFTKKIPSPFNPEVAIGAVSENGYVTLNTYAVKALGVPQSYIDTKRIEIMRSMAQKRKRYAMPRAAVRGEDLLLVDDGVATGASMLLAIEALRKEGATTVSVAVPVMPREAYEPIEQKADSVYLLHSADDFLAVGHYYEDFHQLSDEEVMRYLSNVSK